MPTEWFKRQATFDAKRTGGERYGRKDVPKERRQFDRIRRAEYQYSIRLRKLARHVGDIVKAFPVGNVDASNEINRILKQYAVMITPWANRVANAMLSEVARRDEEVWAKNTKNMSAALKAELKAAPVGVTLRQLQSEQLKYITKIPLDAAQRVHDLTIESLTNGARANEIAQEIRRQGDVSESYANLVARTEVGRASTNLTQARATHIGSEGYIWRTAEDGDVRPSHKKLEGTYHRWDAPPLCDAPNYHAHPGCIWNCRCYPEVVIPQQYL